MKKKTFLILIIVIGVISFISYQLAHSLDWLDRDIQEISFNKKLWDKGRKTKDDQVGGDRYRMITDLKKNYLKIGMTKAEILKLLGKPDDKSCGGIGDINDKIFSYRIGYKFFDPCSLDIEFDTQDTIISFEECCN